MKTIQQTITIGGNTNNPIKVNRLGYGTMRLPGDMVWGEPKDRDQALEILKTARNKGINFLDTADFYGDDITNRLIAEALYPYNDNLLICTKVGAGRTPDKGWKVFNTPDNLRTSIDRNLQTLKTEQLNRGLQEVMPLCIENNIVMIPFWSLQNSLPKNDDKIAVIAKKYNASSAQINIAWLLHFNELILPIPGTSQLKHFEENIDARHIQLTQEDMDFLA